MPLVAKTFDVRGEVFHALTCDAPPRARTPVIYLHGFPDHPPTARAFLDRLGRDRAVLAPWLRGYAPSPLAGPYDIDTLVADVLALIDRWSPAAPVDGRGLPPAGSGAEWRRGVVDMIGHDWGAAITYALCAAAPTRVRRAVTLALPHPLTFMRALATPAQARRSWYIALFQLPGAGRLARARDLALIDRLWRTWSPGFTLDRAARAELHACLAASLPAPLGYYRAMVRPFADARRRLQRGVPPIATPLLQLHGAADGCVLPPTIDDRNRFAAERVLEIVPGLGHFLHLEDPDAIAERVRAWLA